MQIMNITGNVPTKTVLVASIAPEATKDEIIEFALAGARETKASTFGCSFKRKGSVATVSLWTD